MQYPGRGFRSSLESRHCLAALTRPPPCFNATSSGDTRGERTDTGLRQTWFAPIYPRWLCCIEERPMSERNFPSPWSVQEKTGLFIVRDAGGQALGYFYFVYEKEQRPG